MTILTELLNKGWNIKVSEMAKMGEPFVDIDGDLMVFHPTDYNYVAYPEIHQWHDLNVQWLRDYIEKMAEEACDRLDKMVDDLNQKHAPHRIVQFHGPMYVEEIFEDESGAVSFSFSSIPPNDKADAARYVMAFEQEGKR